MVANVTVSHYPRLAVQSGFLSLRVITRLLSPGFFEISRQDFLGILFLFKLQKTPPAISEFIRGGEFFNGAFLSRNEIVFDDLFAVAGIGELQPHHLGILHGLLQALGGMLVFRLGFHHRNRDITPDEQQLIRAKIFLAGMLASQRHDLPGCQNRLFQDGILLPMCILEFWQYIGSASTGFVHSPAIAYKTNPRTPNSRYP